MHLIEITGGVFEREYVSYGILGAKGYLKVCLSDDVSNLRSFLGDVCETGQFWGGCGVLWMDWFESVRFMRYDEEGVV
jgi:hypothetical protein